MQSLDFPEANRTLKAGGNPNTRSLKLAICEHPEFKNIAFFISKWEMDGDEFESQKKHFKKVIEESINRTNIPVSDVVTDSDLALIREDTLNKLLASIQPVYLSVMHQPPPVLLLSGGLSHFDFGYKPMQLPPLPPDPKDN